MKRCGEKLQSLDHGRLIPTSSGVSQGSEFGASISAASEALSFSVSILGREGQVETILVYYIVLYDTILYYTYYTMLYYVYKAHDSGFVTLRVGELEFLPAVACARASIQAQANTHTHTHIYHPFRIVLANKNNYKIPQCSTKVLQCKNQCSITYSIISSECFLILVHPAFSVLLCPMPRKARLCRALRWLGDESMAGNNKSEKCWQKYVCP